MFCSGPSDQPTFRAGSGAGRTPSPFRKRDESAASRSGEDGMPKRRTRDGEWTRAKMAAFIDELWATQSVSRAARSVGMGRQSAYKLRKRLAGQPFAEAWDDAVAALRLAGPVAPFVGSQPCPFCGAVPRRPAGRPLAPAQG